MIAYGLYHFGADVVHGGPAWPRDVRRELCSVWARYPLVNKGKITAIPPCMALPGCPTVAHALHRLSGSTKLTCVVVRRRSTSRGN